MIRNLPKEWEVEGLLSVTDKIRDGNYGPDYPSREEFLTNGVPFLTSTVIADNNQIDFSKIKFISREKHKQLTKVRLRAGDILLTNRGLSSLLQWNIFTRINTPDIKRSLLLPGLVQEAKVSR